MPKKYYKQKNDYSCAIIGLINVLVYLDKEFTFTVQYKFFEHFLSTSKQGTFKKPFEKFIVSFFPSVKKKLAPKLSYLQKELAKGNAVLLGNDDGTINHIGLLLNITKNYVTLCNWGRKYPVKRKLTLKQFNTLLSYPTVCYVIERS